MDKGFQQKKQRLSFSFRIARRYLFSKKSHNAINIITGISAVGIAIGTLALVVVLSVFNGFESLVGNLFSAFDPDLKIELKEGKAFRVDSQAFVQIKNLEEVAVFAEVVQDNALLKYGNYQMPAVIKGVGPEFEKMVVVDSILYDGEFTLYDGAFERAIPGIGVANSMGLAAQFIDPLYIYAPRRSSRVNLLRPENSFIESSVFLSGVFMVKQAAYDEEYVLVSKNLARQLFEYDSLTVTSVELKLKDGVDLKSVQKKVRAIAGEGFTVKDRYEQQESFFSIMQIEKWISYLILSFILLIASFNIIGSLSMLIIDKKADIATLSGLGADDRLIRTIFLFEGWMISLVGAISGIVLGTAISLIQQHFQVLKLGTGYLIDAYPVQTSAQDILIVFGTVLMMGFLAAWYPIRYIKTGKPGENNK